VAQVVHVGKLADLREVAGSFWDLANLVPNPEPSPFDAIREVDERGEYWRGRRLQPLMEYSKWDKFEAVIIKARDALVLVEGQESADYHFEKIDKVFPHVGKNPSDLGGRPGKDYRLTRHAAYLVAMAGDDTKEAVARARIYFARRTEEADGFSAATEKPL
jgi:DNA-damage-inducible protein D